MDKAIARTEIEKHLVAGESISALFITQVRPTFFQVFFGGILVVAALPFQFIALTERGYHVARLDPWGKISRVEFVPHAEVLKVQIKKGWLMTKVDFELSLGRKWRFRAWPRGNEKIGKLDDEAIANIRRIQQIPRAA